MRRDAGIATKASLMVVSRTLLDGDGCAVELAHSLYRGDRYRAVLTIPATGTEAPERVKQPRDRVKVRRRKPLA